MTAQSNILLLFSFLPLQWSGHPVRVETGAQSPREAAESAPKYNVVQKLLVKVANAVSHISDSVEKCTLT